MVRVVKEKKKKKKGRYHEVRTITIDSEPGFLALGEAHVAAGMNNQAWFYRIGPPSEVGPGNTVP